MLLYYNKEIYYISDLINMMNSRRVIIVLITLFYLTLVTGLILIFIYFCNPFWAVLSIFLLTIVVQICNAIVLLNNDRQLEIKLCWLIVIIMLPLLGTLLFIWFGLRPFNVKKWRQYNIESKNYSNLEDYTYTKYFLKNNHELNHLFAYNYNVSQTPIYINNSVKFINNNIDLLKEAVDLIRSAKKLIVLETLILRDSIMTRIIITELLKKKKEGVDIYVLHDWLHGRKLKKQIVKSMVNAGINVGIFNSPGLNIYKSSTNYRLHTKALIIDNKKALFGGSNYADEYIKMNKCCNNFTDFNIIVAGEICNSLLINFFKIWITFTKKYTTKTKSEWINTFNKLHKKNDIHKGDDKILMQLIQGSPDQKEKTLEQTIISLIFKAKKSIYIAVPYFCPSKKIINALNYMSLSGIDVKIIVPGLRESAKLIININRSNYQDLLEGKCRIYEYNGFIHSKYIVIDDNISFIGSANFDYRSLWINFEISSLIYNNKFNKTLKNIFKCDLDNSNEITLSTLNQIFSKKDRFINFFLYLIYPLI